MSRYEMITRQWPDNTKHGNTPQMLAVFLKVMTEFNNKGHLEEIQRIEQIVCRQGEWLVQVRDEKSATKVSEFSMEGGSDMSLGR